MVAVRVGCDRLWLARKMSIHLKNEIRQDKLLAFLLNINPNKQVF